MDSYERNEIHKKVTKELGTDIVWYGDFWFNPCSVCGSSSLLLAREPHGFRMSCNSCYCNKRKDTSTSLYPTLEECQDAWLQMWYLNHRPSALPIYDGS